MILVIDNYDSFTYNVVQALQRLGSEEVKVVRSKEITVEEIEKLAPSRLVVSPGSGTPSEAGVSIPAIKYFAGKIPILGVCLGHQSIGEAFGADIVQAKRICHGVVEKMEFDGQGLFRTIPKTAEFTRYHSLKIDENSLPACLEVTARSEDGDIMGVRHKEFCIEGVQFHPESIASGLGDEIFKCFLHYRREALDTVGLLNKIVARQDLTEDEACLFIENLADGVVDERVMAAVFAALAVKGAVVSEIVGFARGLLKVAKPLPVKFTGHAEIVGTGGDCKGSFNISSLAAIVSASCGQLVTKHGNRAVSSKSGSADFYENLGINIMADPARTCELIQKTDFGFLMATVYHSAMRFAAPVRKALGIKTVMNIMGPLLNPAGAEYELLGVYSKDLLETYGRAAKKLGAKRVLVVTSEDGFDEISPCAPTYCFQINEDGKEYKYVIDPAKYGITDDDPEELYGGNGAENASLAMDLLNGKGKKTIKYAVCLNAGAVLYISGKAKTIKDGYEMAMNAIDSGKALSKLTQIVEVSKSLA